MFGYVKVYKPELKMKEFEMYRGIYCSLCKQLGKSYGLFARMTLSYDFAFMAILHYMKTTYGWTPAPVLDCNYMHHMTTFLFDVDVDKLERLVNGKCISGSVESTDEDCNDNNEKMSFKLF